MWTTNPVFIRKFVVCIICSAGTFSAVQTAYAQARVNGGRPIDKAVFSGAFKERRAATPEEAKPFAALFDPRGISEAWFDELTRVYIFWNKSAKPQPGCVKDALIRVETLDKDGQIVGTAYSRVEVPYADGKGLILPFDNRADTGKAIRMTILPANTKITFSTTLPLTRH